jgi:hypothetical protein
MLLKSLHASAVALATLSLAASAQAQAIKLVRSLSGPSGRVVAGRFEFDETRNRFVYPTDSTLTVYFEWESTPGDHTLTALWKQPDGRTASVSPDVRIQTTDSALRSYWIFNITPASPKGAWTVEIRVDGQPAGSHVFELAGVDGSERLTLDQVYRRYGPSVVSVHRLDENGRRIDTSSGFVVAPDTIATAFQSIDAAVGVEVEFADGRRTPVREILALSRLDDWALLRMSTGDLAAVRRTQCGAAEIGQRLAMFSLDGNTRVLMPVDVGAVSAPRGYGTRIQFSPVADASAAGGPLISEAGCVVGVVGGYFVPGGRPDVRMTGFARVLQTSAQTRNAATSAALLPDTLPTVGQTFAELQSAGTLTPIVRPMIEMTVAMTAAVAPKGNESPTRVIEFSPAVDSQVLVYSSWIKKAKISKGELAGGVYDLANRMVRKIAPKKVSLGSQEKAFGVTFPVRDLPAGYYRIDLTWDGQPVWRSSIRITD